MSKKSDCIEEREEYIICESNGKKITVRDLQLEVLTIMDEIHRVCVKNDIKYALMNYGPVLGAVMWYDDFMKLKKLIA